MLVKKLEAGHVGYNYCHENGAHSFYSLWRSGIMKFCPDESQ